MTCKLDLDNLQPDDRNEFVFFATHDFIIYKNRNRLELASCEQEVLSGAVLPIDYRKYEVLDLGDALFFLFNGLEIVIMDKQGLLPIQFKLDPLKIGQAVTKIFPSSENGVIFGTKQADRIQFVNYDFMERNRIAQSAFWKVTMVTDCNVTSNILYAVLDNSIIVACDMSTGETIWTKFETAKINRGIFFHDNFVFYSCQGLLKKTDGKTTQVIRIPLISVHSLEHISGGKAYVTSNEGKNLCQYDLLTETLKWEIFSHYPILESLPAKGKPNDNLLLVRTTDYMGIVNISAGRAETHVRSSNISRIRETTDHILIHKSTGSTTLLSGTEDV